MALLARLLSCLFFKMASLSTTMLLPLPRHPLPGLDPPPSSLPSPEPDETDAISFLDAALLGRMYLFCCARLSASVAATRPSGLPFAAPAPSSVGSPAKFIDRRTLATRALAVVPPSVRFRK